MTSRTVGRESADEGEAGDDEVIVEVLINAADSDMVIGHLWMNHTTGIEERDIEAGGDEAARLLLRAGFASAGDADAALTSMTADYTEVGRMRPDGSELEHANAFAQTVAIGDRLVIQPGGRSPAPDAEGVEDAAGVVTVTINAGRSFGHGGHPTTRLMLAAIVDLVDQAPHPPTRMLDVGCGSGVLAISAIKLGVSQAVGIDTNPDAISASAANAETNEVASQLTLHQGDLEVIEPALLGTFDLVVANLEAPILESLADSLVALVAPDAWLLLSGLLESRWASLGQGFIDRSTPDGCTLEQWRTVAIDGWAGVTLHSTVTH